MPYSILPVFDIFLLDYFVVGFPHRKFGRGVARSCSEAMEACNAGVGICILFLQKCVCYIVGPGMSFSESPTVLQYPPPTLGQHTSEVLREQLNYDDSKIKELQQLKVIQ